MNNDSHNPIMRLLSSKWASVVALVLNMLLAFVVYNVCRVIFMLENYDALCAGQSADAIFRVFKGGYMFDRAAIVYTNSLYIILMLLPLWMKETRLIHKIEKWLFVVVNSVAVVINLMDAVYFPYTSRRTTTSVFSEFSNETNLSGIFLTEIASHWYLVVCGIVIIYLMYRCYAMQRLEARDISICSDKMRYTGLMTLSLAIAIPLSIGACRGGLGTGIRPITINNANQYVDRPVDCAAVLNTPFSLLRTIGKNVFTIPDYYSSLDDAMADSPMRKQSVSEPQRGLLKGKNVVIIIVESFGREYIGALNASLEGGRYKGYTPNIDSLISRSTVFRHSFANGRKSIDGMPSVLCGIPMFVEPFVLTPSSMNDYTSIAGLLADEGYQTAFFHGANRGSMGFMALANKIGFGEYYGRQDYASDSRFGGDSDFDGNWGIWDEPFLQYFSAKMTEMKEPFMTALFTVSSHHPFVVPDKYKNTYREEELPIHKCIRYTDMALGRFFKTASRQKWYDNTVFVITSDHTNQSNHDYYSTDIGRFASPIIIFDPSGTLPTGMREAIAQQIDIVPTLLGLLGYDKPYFSYGIDLFNTPEEETYAVNYLNGTYQYAKGNYLLQFDGEKTKAVYSLQDSTLRKNILNNMPQAQREQMERELKSIIYEYMYRMVNDKMR